MVALDTLAWDVWALPAMPEPISTAAGVLGERVRDRRQQLGLSQEAMASAIGIHWSFLGQIERGQRNINLHNLLKLAAGLGVDPADLVRGLAPPEHPPGAA